MIKVIFLSLIILCCSSCIKTVHVSGHLFEEKELHALKAAKSKQDIENLLGSPTSVSSFGPETWYYITTKKETISFWPDKVLEQNIIAISFKKGDIIDVVARYNEKNIKHHELVPEITIVKGNDSTTAQQFFSNVGKFNSNKKESPAMPRSGF